MKPEEQIFLNEKLEKERQKSDDAYAIKLVEKAFFIFIGAICLAFIGYLLKMVWPS